MSTCYTWSMPDERHFRGLCPNNFRPENSTGASCPICATSVNGTGIATLRAFDVATGAYQWQVLNFWPIGTSTDGSIWGYKWRESKEAMQVYQLNAVPINLTFTGTTGFGFWASQGKFQLKTIGTGADGNSTVWIADYYKVGITGEQTLVLEDVDRIAAVDGVMPTNVPDNGFQQSFNESFELCRISNAGLHLGKIKGTTSQQISCLASDQHYKTDHHYIRLLPSCVFASSSGTPMWVLRSGTQEARFPLYGTAAEIEAAFLEFAFITSATVTGGPACLEKVEIELEYANTTDKIDYFIIEYATNTYVSGFISSSWTGAVQIWDSATHTPVAPFWDSRLLPYSSTAKYFSEDGAGIISNGNWGPSSAERYGKLTWTMPGGTPNWGTVNAAAWLANPFGGMTDTQERDWVSVPFVGFVMGPVSRAKGVTAIKYGMIAVTSTACRLPSSGADYVSTILLDEGTGATIDVGKSGFQASTNLKLNADGSYYLTGVQHLYAEVLFSSTPGASLYIGAHAYPGGIEASVTDITTSIDDNRESDLRGFGEVAVGSHIIKRSQYFASEATGSRRSTNFSSTSSNAISLGGMWTSHSIAKTADGSYPWGSYYLDILNTLSLGFRLSESTEWRFLHGNFSSGTFTAQKTSSWFSYSESIATVQAELTAWWGTIAGSGAPIIKLNPFGDPPNDDDPAWPTWQAISQIYIYRDRPSPEPLSPLVPVSNNSFMFEWRNNTLFTGKHLSGLTLDKGLMAWSRDIGVAPGPVDVNVITNVNGFMTLENNTVVVHTQCKPDKFTPVFGRGE